MKPVRSLLLLPALLIAGVAILASTATAATRPDDREGTLGIGAQATSPAAAHPDNRTGVRGVTPAAAEPGGIDWTTIGIGVGAGVAALLLLAAAVLTMRHGGHRPHRPALGH